MPLDLGVFIYGEHAADLLFNQCERAGGRHAHLRLRPGDREADHLLVLAPPVGPDSRPKPPNGPRRWRARRRGDWDAVWADYAWEKLGRDPGDITALVYEPVEAFTDAWWDVARRRASRVFGPDARATHPIPLPVMWSFDDPASALRGEPPPEDKPVPLVAVTSGTTHHPGHRERMRFLEDLRRAGVPFELYGRRLPASLRPVGPLRSKANALRPARCALVIENSSAGDLYVTEKLWDALLCWSLPLYFGTAAPDAMIPPESFVRLPDLGERGIETVRAVAGDPGAWRARLEAIAEARRRILGPLRLVEWAASVIPEGAGPVPCPP
jgi:hypothetical protein